MKVDSKEWVDSESPKILADFQSMDFKRQIVLSAFLFETVPYLSCQVLSGVSRSSDIVVRKKFLGQ